MPRLTLVPAVVVEGWDDAEIRWYYREAHRLGVPAATSLALESHYPEGMLGFCRLWWAMFHEGRIERPLMEALRVRIATQAGCSYCADSRLPSSAGGPVGEPVDRSDARSRAAQAFADRVSLTPWDVGAPAWQDLRAVFSEPEIVELATFVAWQYSGPRMLRSWGAERFKQGPRVEPSSLPVAIAYAESSRDAGVTARPLPAAGVNVESAPRDWTGFIAPRPDLLAAWTGLWRVAIDDGPLPARIGQLIRIDLAHRLAHPAWASSDVPALDRPDCTSVGEREEAALGYARAVAAGRDLTEEEEATLASLFSEAELVQLGLATAIQVGALLVDRSRDGRSGGPIAMSSQ